MIWIDFTLVGLVFVCVVIGLLRGFFKEVFSLGFWMLASWVSLSFSPEFCRIGSLLIATLPPSLAVAVFLEAAISHPAARMVASFVALFAITLSLGGLIGFLLSVLAKKKRTNLHGSFRRDDFGHCSRHGCCYCRCFTGGADALAQRFLVDRINIDSTFSVTRGMAAGSYFVRHGGLHQLSLISFATFYKTMQVKK